MEAQELSIHILQITKNENIFLPKYKVEITDRIANLGMDIFLNLWKANSYKVGTPERKRLQELALENCIDILAIWNLAIRAFHLKHKKTEYVVGKIIAIRDATKKWMKSDIDRLTDGSKDIENEVV